MDKRRAAIDAILPCLDDHTFAIFAGQYNSQCCVSLNEEVELLHYALEQRHQSNPDIPWLKILLDIYLA